MINFPSRLSFCILLFSITFMTASIVCSAESDESATRPNVIEKANSTNTETAINDVEMGRRFNELRHELLDNQAASITWWLAVIGIVLAHFAIIIPIIGYFAYIEFKNIQKQAKGHLDEIIKIKEEIVVLRKTAEKEAKKISDMNSKLVAESNTSEEAIKVAQKTKNDLGASLLDRSIADALLLQKSGKNMDAIKQWQAIAKRTEESNSDIAVNAWFSIGYLFQIENYEGVDQAKNENASDAYTKAIRLNPSHVESYFNRGNVHTEDKRYEKAIRDYTSAIHYAVASNTNYPEVIYFNRGNAKFFIENYTGAIDDYNHAILCGAVLRNSWFNLGNAEIKLGNYEKALKSYDESIKADGSFKHAYSNRAVAKIALGRVDEGLSDIDQFPSDAEDRSKYTGTPTKQIIQDAIAKKNLDHKPVTVALGIVGNVGSAGIIGGVGSKGGKGLPGGPGFWITVSI